MAMDKSALLELLEALKAAEVDDRVRMATQHLYQALINAEANVVIGADRWERSDAQGAPRRRAVSGWGFRDARSPVQRQWPPLVPPGPIPPTCRQ